MKQIGGEMKQNVLGRCPKGKVRIHPQNRPQWGEAIFTRKIVSFARNCFQNQLPRWLTCFTHTGEKTYKLRIVIFVENIEFCEKLFPKPISQMSYMFTNTGENVYKTAVLKTHKFFPQWGEAIFGRKIVSFVSKCILHQHPMYESNVNSHRRKALQTQKCDICGKYISKPLAWRCANIATVG